MFCQRFRSGSPGREDAAKRQELGRPATDDPDVYDNFLYGRRSFFLYASTAENQTAGRFFERAIGHDPGFAMACGMPAWTHAFDAMDGWSDVRSESRERAHALADHALTLERALPAAYFVKGLAFREQGEYAKALAEAEKAIVYEPNYAKAHVLLATLLYYAGRPREGLERMRKAITLNPHHPYNYTFHLGQAYFILGRYDEAARTFYRGLESNPSAERLHLWLAASLAQAGDYEEAEWEVEQVLILNPDFTLDRVKETFPFKDPADLERFLEGLEKALGEQPGIAGRPLTGT